MRLPGGEGGEGEAQRELKISICDSSSYVVLATVP